MRTEWSEVDLFIRTHVVRYDWRGTELLPKLRQLVEDSQHPANGAPPFAQEFLDGPTGITLATLRGGVDPAATLPPDENGQTLPIPGQAGLALVDRLDRWLVTQDNEPAPATLDEWLRTAITQLVADLGGPAVDPEQPLPIERRSTLHGILGATWSRLLDSLSAALLLPHESELAQRLNRLFLVSGLIERRSAYQRVLTPKEIATLLAYRTILLPDPPFPQVVPPDQVKLVRQATTSDLFVVRREWRGYLADEIADIRNVMAKEKNETEFIRIDESEVIATTDQSTSSSSESSSEASDESSFNELTKRELDLDINANGQVNVSAQYSSVKLDVSAGFSADFSLKDSTDRATQIAKRAISRSASKVETQTREQRTRRTLARTELREKHGLDNSTSDHVRGVYRWVKRVDRFQIWRYPDRLQLEFQIPEPGRYLLEQLGDPPARAGAIGEPPAFVIPNGGYTRANYLAQAAIYGATGLPAPPQPITAAAGAIALMSKDDGKQPAGDMWNPPVLSQAIEIPVPAGYQVTKVRVNVEATPMHAKWVREMTGHSGFDTQEAYHTITASVVVGDQVSFTAQPGTDQNNKNAVMWTPNAGEMVLYLDAHLRSTNTELVLGTPVTVKLPVSASLVGAYSGNVGVELVCELTPQAETTWVQGVYDSLRAAYDAWVREWRSQQALAGRPPALAERSPARHAEMIQAELRRHVISWMLGESPFKGRPAVRTPPQPPPEVDVTPDISIEKALDSASTIQFLEQCLEWSNLAWVAYPYYWADRERWPDLMDLETVDPTLGSFLRAGSVRVVVPARPGFSNAVTHWLTFRQPWLGGSCPPVPGQPMYTSVAREIQDQLLPPPDGEPGESWEVALPTTLQWLDGRDVGLPRNELVRLGQPPHEPTDKLLPDAPP
jgi:hypothetical protein